MEPTASEQRRMADDEQRSHVERLLARYPEVTDAERAEIIRFLKKALALQVGLLASSEAVRTNLQRFKDDHPEHFSVDLKGMLVALMIVTLIVIAAVLAWDAGAQR